MKKNEIKNEIILHKPNEIIETLNRPVSIMSCYAYNYLLSKFQEEKNNYIFISPKEILNAIGAINLHEQLYKCLDELQKTQVTSKDSRGKLWGSFVLLSAFKKNNDKLYIEIPQLIANRLYNNDSKNSYYTTIKLLEEKAFKCSYSFIFYEIFKKYEGVNIPIYTMEEIRQLTETEGKYKLYYDFKKRVLNPALAEINNFSQNFFYELNEIYLGKKVVKISFIKHKLEKKLMENIIDITPVKEYSDKFLAAIEKVKKNQYVAKKYSQRAVRKAVQQFGEERVIKAFKEMYKYNRTITSFSKFLNASISEIKENEKLKKEIKEKNITTAEIKQEINKPIDISTFEGMRNFISSELMNSNNIETSKKIIILGELSNLKEVEELKEIVAKYNLEINLKLF